jgi:hypothetical protein
MLSDPIQVMMKIAGVFDALGIPYLIGGSVASSTHGLPRLTEDVDFVADFATAYVEPFVAALQDEFYVDDHMIREAIARQDSFNIIFLETMDKADIFVLKSDPWAREEMARRQLKQLDPGDPDSGLYFSSPEDTILHKLDWYRQGGGISDRQWRDVMGVMKLRAQTLDFAYLRRWAEQLRVMDLLNRALDDAGLPLV